MNLDKDEIIQKIIEHSHENVYLVGGAVRDGVLEKETFDKDIIVFGDAKEWAKSFAQKHDATFVPLDEENHIYRVVMSDKINYLDITSPINNSLDEDIERRDFTINAISINLKTKVLYDPLCGIKDIEDKVIRAISEDNIVEDPLRILRAYRFNSTLGFKIDDETLYFLKKHKDEIQKSANERINLELLKLFDGKNAHNALLNMDKIGLLDFLFPVMETVKKVPANSHHHLDLFNHSIETVKQIDKIYKTLPNEVKEHLESNFSSSTRLAHLKFAGFFHDIGKFPTWSIQEDGRHRFIKHDDVGSKMSVEILRKMCFSKKQIEYISKMVKYHIYPANVVSSPELNEKIFMRYIRKMDENSIDAIVLSMADRLSARGEAITQEIVDKNINGLTELLKFYVSVKDTLEPLPKLLSGNDVMDILSISPSPQLGRVIDALQDAQINGDVSTKNEAIKFIKGIKL